MQITFQPPDENSPGYLRRLKQALSFQDAINSKKVSEKTIDDLAGFLSTYVVGIDDKEEAKNYLLDASENQFNEMLETITGRKMEDITKKNGNTLSSGSKVPASKRRLKHSS